MYIMYISWMVSDIKTFFTQKLNINTNTNSNKSTYKYEYRYPGIK